MKQNLLLVITFILLCTTHLNLIVAQENRSFEGTDNNLDHPNWGGISSHFHRMTPINYADGIAIPGGLERPNARVISNAIFEQTEFIANPGGISDFGWGFGQFIDHDITFNLDTSKAETSLVIPIPACDAYFDPDCTGEGAIFMHRAMFDATTGTSRDNPREQTNLITSWIDASGVYGSRKARADWLRTFEDGKLKTSAGNLLPFNTVDGEHDSEIDLTAPFMIIEGPPQTKYYIAGDIRANEQPSLTSFHILFVREHNRLCEELKATHPTWTDEELYQRARKMVGALIQVVLYEEWLPTMGVELDEYVGYDSDVRGDIIGIFSSAAYRLGHTLVNDQLIRLDGNGDTLSFGSIQIKDAFFNLDIIRNQGGIDPIFRGMATQRQQKFDAKVVSTLRNFLFGPPGYGGLDLVALNIQRARERGFPDYNTIRETFGLAKKASFYDITTDESLAKQLEDMYGNVNKLDPWVAMVCEDIDAENGLHIGETMRIILKKQFESLRDGDRFWYENDDAFSESEKEILRTTTLSNIIKRNTNIIDLQDNIFIANDIEVGIDMSPFAGIRTINIEAFPNPTPNQFNIRIKARQPQMATLTITDNAGRIVLTEQLTIKRGDNQFNYALDDKYADGLYIITLQSGDNVGKLKLVKQ